MRRLLAKLEVVPSGRLTAALATGNDIDVSCCVRDVNRESSGLGLGRQNFRFGGRYPEQSASIPDLRTVSGLRVNRPKGGSSGFSRTGILDGGAAPKVGPRWPN